MSDGGISGGCKCKMSGFVRGNFLGLGLIFWWVGMCRGKAIAMFYRDSVRECPVGSKFLVGLCGGNFQGVVILHGAMCSRNVLWGKLSRVGVQMLY